jgi:crossover junction endodeoxyribonuclease RuvC
MTPIGVDLSLTSTGFSCGEKLGVIASKLSGVPRLDEVARAVCDLASDIEEPLYVIEGYSFASRNSQAHSIGELGGVVRHQLWLRNFPFINVPPTSRAKFATGRGNAAKTEVMSSVSARTGIIFTGKGADDMCDAWILEEIGLYILGKSRFSWPSTHVDAVAKIDCSVIGS